MRVLALNCGSSSIRCAVIDTGSGQRGAVRHEELAGRTHEAVLADWTEAWRNSESAEIRKVEAIGHRVVYGGESFRTAAAIDLEVLGRIEAVSHQAPLHNPANLAGIRALSAAFPELPQVAVFDTAFHHSLPAHAFLYALPYAFYKEHGFRRYGFHGSSHRSAAEAARDRLGLPMEGSRVLVAHLGNGCSAAAVRNGLSIDTTMGASPLEGLVMGTRSGDIDPSLGERIAEIRGLDFAGVTKLLNRESGLLGLSELSGDMRELEEAARKGHEGALRAIEVFTYRLAKALASLVVPLAGLDALVFTGGIGENSAQVRQRTVAWLLPLGLAIDATRNARHGEEHGGLVSPDGHTPVLVVPSDEEAAIAAETAAALGEAERS